MSKYKTGDKFEIEIKEVVVSECGKALYAVEDVPILILDDYILNRLKQVKTEEPELDWSKVEVDTPILVMDKKESIWHKRYFAKYENGVVYAWIDGKTSWTADSPNYIIEWECAKLAEDSNDC